MDSEKPKPEFRNEAEFLNLPDEEKAKVLARAELVGETLATVSNDVRAQLAYLEDERMEWDFDVRKELANYSYVAAGNNKNVRESNYFKLVLERLPRIPTCFHSEIALAMIDADCSWILCDDIEKFWCLDSRVLTAMLKQKLGNVIARNLEHFLNVNYTELAEQLIDMGDSQAVAWNLKKFRDIDHAQIAKRIMAKGEAGYIARYLENFAGLHHTELADWLLDHGKAENLAANLRKFIGVDQNQIAAKMLSNGDAKVLYNYLHNFHDLDKSIAIGIVDAVIFPQNILKSGEDGDRKTFKNLDESVALHMAEKGMGLEVCDNLAIFGKVDLRKLAEAMVKKSVNAFADCIEYFGEIEMDGLADLAIKNNQAWDFVTRLDEFRINDFARLALEFEKANLPQAMVKCLYLAKDEEQKNAIRSALEKYDKQSLAEEVCREGDFIVLGNAMDYFRDLNYWDLVEITIRKGSNWINCLPDIIRYFKIDDYFNLAEKFSNFSIPEGVAECWRLCMDQQQKADIEMLYNLMGVADPNLPPLVKVDQ